MGQYGTRNANPSLSLQNKVSTSVKTEKSSSSSPEIALEQHEHLFKQAINMKPLFIILQMHIVSEEVFYCTKYKNTWPQSVLTQNKKTFYQCNKMKIPKCYFTYGRGWSTCSRKPPMPSHTRQVKARARASAASSLRKEDIGIYISWKSAAYVWPLKKSVWSVDVRLNPAALFWSCHTWSHIQTISYILLLAET